MGYEEIKQNKDKKKDENSYVKSDESPHSSTHWIIYTIGTFISFFVFLEFLGALFFLSRFSPSSFVYHLTPAYLIFGRTMPTFLVSVLLIFSFYLVLSKIVYKNGGIRYIVSSNFYLIREKGLIFKQERSNLLFPFYIVPTFSLGYHIIISSLDLSHLLTYIIFLLFAVSLIEFYQVALK